MRRLLKISFFFTGCFALLLGGFLYLLRQQPATSSPYVIFNSDRSGVFGTYIVLIDGSGARPLPDDLEISSLRHSTSADRRWTAMTVYEHTGDSEIYIVDADGITMHNVTHNPAQDWFPLWSPPMQVSFRALLVGGAGLMLMIAGLSRRGRLAV